MRSLRLRTWLLIFAVATTTVGLFGKAIWDSDAFDWGPEASLRSACRQWMLPMPETVRDIEVAYADRRMNVPGEDFWMRVRLRMSPEEMADWMQGASAGMWGTQWKSSDNASRNEAASRFDCSGGTSYLIPHPGQRKFHDAIIYAEPSKGKIDIVWIR